MARAETARGPRCKASQREARPPSLAIAARVAAIRGRPPCGRLAVATICCCERLLAAAQAPHKPAAKQQDERGATSLRDPRGRLRTPPLQSKGAPLPTAGSWASWGARWCGRGL